MGIIGKMDDSVINYNESDGNDWRNPNSIVRNTMRLRPTEFAVFTFVQDLMEGDASFFHNIQSMNDNGKQFFKYEYCSRNEDESGRPRDANCVWCLSKVEKERARRLRYSYWAYVYYVYHAEQNPSLENYSDAMYWEPMIFGKRQYYRESVLKPQLLTLSGRDWQSLREENETFSDPMIGGMFMRTSVRDAQGRVSYKIQPSRVRDIKSIELEDLYPMVDKLPAIDSVVSGLVEEFDFNQFSLSVSVGTADEEAFNSVVEGVGV